MNIEKGESVCIICAPHPDDETLACGGTIVQKIRDGQTVIIIFMTDGSHSHSHTFGIWSKPSPAELRTIRKFEAIQATSVLGVPRNALYFWDFEDGKLDENDKLAEIKMTRLLNKIPT